MAKYTVELNSLINANFDLGLSDYPLFDETYRAVLNTKIKDHYRFREIGFETPALFKVYLNRTMREIMPLYNQYYKSAKLEFNPLYNVDYSDISNRINSGTSSSNVDGKLDTTKTDTLTKTGTDTTASDSVTHLEGGGTNDINNTDTITKNEWDKHSDTPQGSIANLENGTYLSDARNTTANNTNVTDGLTTTTQTEDGTSGNDTIITHNTTDVNGGEHHDVTSTTITGEKGENEDVNKTVSGVNGVSSSELLLKYRSTFLNIDMMIISELNDLFMGLY